MQCFCILALIEAGIPEPDPMACGQIEVKVDRFADEGQHRGCWSADATAERFAEGRDLAVGALAPEEWSHHGIAVVWWQPRRGGQLCQYIEAKPGTDLALGEPAENEWRETYLPVFGPPVPNNHCPAPHSIRPWWPWTHAADRQLDLLAQSQR